MPSQFVSKQFKIHNLKLKEVKTLQELTRPNIWKLKPYSSARDEYKGVTASVFLDANENPYNTPHNRYPDPMQCELKTLLSKIKKVSPKHIFLGNGSDEAIDLVFRAFCEPGKDNVVAIDPTYGMYQVCADVNDVEYRKVLLDDDFQFSADKLLSATDEHTKLIFLCSPNNPTGNDLLRSEIVKVLCQFEGLVMLDEAYNDFDSIADYINVPSDFGASIGRYANRINQGRFVLDGDTIQLPQNNFGHCLHGGPKGWQYQVYEANLVDPMTLELTRISPDGDENFPGNVTAKVTYQLTEDNAIDIKYSATTDKKTIINMTNHSYFNLAGDPSKASTDNIMYVNADYYTPVDSTFMTTGEIASVKDTPMDFTTPKAIITNNWQRSTK